MFIDLGTLVTFQCLLYSDIVAVKATLTVDPDRTCYWHLPDGDQPAYIGANGSQEWWRDGKLHRDGDQPAIIWANGSRQWWRNGKQVR